MNSSIVRLRPQTFWECYRDDFRKRCTWADYCGVRSTTPVAMAAANAVIENSFNLTPSNEYLRIDSIGYDATPRGEQHNWRLRVAFEHENDKDYTFAWRDEFCKLAHVAADMCVIASYWHYRKYATKNRAKTLEDVLRDSIDHLREPIGRVRRRQWLFIFGPQSKCDEQFVAYTFIPDAQKPESTLSRLHDGDPLWPKRHLRR